jgi:signal peptidase I
MVRRSAIRLVGAGLGLLLLGGAWYFVAPRQIGGSATYAIIVGSSMEPEIERGDLVVTRTSDRYEVGDVAAYRSANLDAVVLHRIVGRSGDRFLFKGDANGFVDPERPVVSDLVGKRWIQLPFAGAALQWLREPRSAALAAAAALLLVLSGGAGVHGRRRRQGRKDTAPPPGGQAPARWWTQAALVFTGGSALAFILLGLVAFTRPTATVRPATELYSQSGAFGYSAFAPKTPVYDRSELGTDDTLFVALVREVSLTFAYGSSRPPSMRCPGRSASRRSSPTATAPP